eukprot:m.449815 g.449815  ORF g.449815 m.449815 type:complete len:71 (+) comp21508_c0_seq34:2274-2486(+)
MFRKFPTEPDGIAMARYGLFFAADILRRIKPKVLRFTWREDAQTLSTSDATAASLNEQDVAVVFVLNAST